MTTCNWLSSCDHLPLSPLNTKKAAQPSTYLLLLRNSLPPPLPSFLRNNNQKPRLSPLPRFSTFLLLKHFFPCLSYPPSFKRTLFLFSVPIPRTRTSLSHHTHHPRTQLSLDFLTLSHSHTHSHSLSLSLSLTFTKTRRHKKQARNKETPRPCPNNSSNLTALSSPSGSRLPHVATATATTLPTSTVLSRTSSLARYFCYTILPFFFHSRFTTGLRWE